MEEKLNKEGQNLEEFLAAYDRDEFPRPSLTVDNIVFSLNDDRPVVLLVKRGNHPYIGDWALPGGFVSECESCEDAALRELAEETGLTDVSLEQLAAISTPMRDARGWSVSVCFMAVIDEPKQIVGMDDAEEAAWFTIDYAAAGDLYQMILTSLDKSVVLDCELKVARNSLNIIDFNNSEIVRHGGVAFDHAKIILHAIEKL